MTAHSPSAFTLSALLHAGMAAIILSAVFVSQQRQSKQPVIFELVAGEGNNYAATEAPALGSSDKLKLPAAKETPAPVPPLPAPAAVETIPPPAAATDFAKAIKRIEARKVKKAEAQIKAEREAEAKRLSKEEFDRLHKQQMAAKTASPRAPNAPRVDAEGIAKGVVGGSTANKTGGAGGKALTREEQSLLDSYYTFLKQRLHDALQKPPGLSDRLTTKVQVKILADGTLTDAQILQSSGSDEFDRAALAAIASVGSIGPKPDGRSDTLTFSFRMLDTDNSE